MSIKNLGYGSGMLAVLNVTSHNILCTTNTVPYVP